uniref:Glucosamine/galactosamine-6-phosphate isomerase domain-containing protein n=1 Tax=Proboscia inermis TaxID=420281 RepID=A0A7S0GC45_9STRA
MTLIGVGRDGHVGSIYPDIDDTAATRAVVPITGVDGMGQLSTKISLSLAAMRASRRAVVACAGKSLKAPLGKAEAMVRALEGPDETPRSFPVSALRETATWLLDEDSAMLLSETTTGRVCDP